MSEPAPRHGEPVPPLITADGLSLSTGVGSQVGPWSFSAQPGAVAILGPAGSGKSLLLCALAGRLTGVGGQLTVAGQPGIGKAKALRRATSVARIADYVDLEDGLSVGDAITERTLLEAMAPAPAAAHFTHAAGLIDLKVDHRDRIGTLSPLDRAKLTLALACIRPSSLIVYDDLARELDVAEQSLMWGWVNAISLDGTPVAASTNEPTTVPPDVALIDLGAMALADTQPDGEE